MWAAVAAAHLAGPAAAAAQGARWTLTPSFAVAQGYDDNVRLNNLGDNTTEEYTTGLRPSAELTFNGRRSRLGASYQAIFQRYYGAAQLNRGRHRGQFTASRQLTRNLSLFASDSFSMTPSTDDALEDVVGGTLFRRVGSRVNEASAGADVAFAERTSLRVQYRYHLVRFDQEQSELARLRGGDGHGVDAALRHRVSRRLSLGADWGLRKATLVNEETFDVQHGELAGDYAVTRFMSVSFAAGVAHLVTQNETRTGPSYRLGWSGELRDISFSADYRRSFVPSFGFGGTFQNQQLRASVRAALTRRLFGEGEYSLRLTESLTPEQPTFQSTRMLARLGYSVQRWMSVGLFYAYSHQDSRRAGGTVDRNRVGIEVVTSKPIRLR